ncbi:uncharacterized protein LOC141855725 isoform X2 [Brevipalpus obovatus]|uniref:uncharacterized protein LOC141855725 isoform X2 n=1 Tax=Brevipalpus obovatus TaxID=246614 RepID=UPI003D9F500A
MPNNVTKQICVCQICICGEHKCDPNNLKGTVRVIEDQQHHNQCQKSSSCGNFHHQNQCQFTSSCVHENEMKTCCQSIEEKHRKKWQKSEENLKSICKTYPTTSIDSSQRSSSQASGHNHSQALRYHHHHHHKSKKSKNNRLPPIQRFKSNSELHKISDTNKSKAHHKSTSSVVEAQYQNRSGETSDTRNQTRAGTSLSYSHPLDHLYSVDRDLRVDHSVREDNSMSCEPEWIVTKPEKVKPQDNLRLEGEMDLETTFRSTIDSSAQRMLASRGEQVTGVGRGQEGFGGRGDLKPPKTCTLSRKSANRPKTSLKFGGKGYFTTSNDTYKNFVIVDTSREKLVQERLEKIVQETSRNSDGKSMSKTEKEEYHHQHNGHNGDDQLKQEYSSDSSYSQFEASNEIRSKTMDETKKLAADYHMGKEHQHQHHHRSEEDDDGEGQDLETDGEDRNVIIDSMINKMNDIQMTSSDMKSNRRGNRMEEEFREHIVNREQISIKDEMKSMEMMKSEKLMEKEHHSIHRMMNGNHEHPREEEEEEEEDEEVGDGKELKQSKASKEMKKSKQDQELTTRTHDAKSLSSRREQQQHQRKSELKSSSHANTSSKVHDKKMEQINGISHHPSPDSIGRATPIRPSPIRPVSSLTVSGKFKSDVQYSKVAEDAAKSQRRHYETLDEGESKSKSQSKSKHIHVDSSSNNVVAAGKRYYKSNVNEMNKSNGTLAATKSRQNRSNLSKSTHNLNEQSLSSVHKRTSDERISRFDQQQQSEAERRRHRSVPRSRVSRNKNESQLKFDGEMDFVTTTKQSYRNGQINSIDHRNRPPRRDLFRTSSEAEFMVKPAFDESTTYNSQFRNKLYCPALDLNSRRSDFMYKGEAGGHHFYLPTNQL